MRRSRFWLAAAVLLFAAAAWLMRGKPKASPRAAHQRDEFPIYLRQKEHARLQKRIVALPPLPDAGPRPRMRDPFLAALPPVDRGANRTAMVFEAEAMKSMPIGRMFLRCIKRDGDDEKMRERIGIGVDDVERMGVSDEVLIMAGSFGGARFDALPDVTRERRGAHGRLYVLENGRTLGVYDDQVLIIGERPKVEAAIDRMDGGESGQPAIPDHDSYGEVYGVLSVDRLAEMLQHDQPDLAQRLRQAAEQVSLHVDATSDVLLVADVTGPNGQLVGDLGKTLGGVLSLGRLQAGASRDDQLSELLETARVRPRDGSFSVEVALPLPLLERGLGPCAKGWEDAGP